MSGYFSSVLFVHTDEALAFVEPLQANSVGSAVTPVPFEVLSENPADTLKNVDHVVLAGDISFLKEMIRYSLEFHFSLGFIPLPKQRNLIRLSYPTLFVALVFYLLKSSYL